MRGSLFENKKLDCVACYFVRVCVLSWLCVENEGNPPFQCFLDVEKAKIHGFSMFRGNRIGTVQCVTKREVIIIAAKKMM